MSVLVLPLFSNQVLPSDGLSWGETLFVVSMITYKQSPCSAPKYLTTYLILDLNRMIYIARNWNLNSRCYGRQFSWFFTGFYWMLKIGVFYIGVYAKSWVEYELSTILKIWYKLTSSSLYPTLITSFARGKVTARRYLHMWQKGIFIWIIIHLTARYIIGPERDIINVCQPQFLIFVQ